MSRGFQNEVVLCFGVKGQGKSFSVKRSLDKLGRHVPVYVWDFNREYAGDCAKDGIQHGVVFRNWQHFLTAASSQQGHIGRVCVQVSRERFASFCRFVHRCGNCTVVIDEAHDFVDTSENKQALRELLTTSRHRRINAYVAAWRPTDLPAWVRHCADEIRAFNTTEVNDLEWYRGACGAEFVNKLPRLRPRECAVWRRGMVPRRSKE